MEGKKRITRIDLMPHYGWDYRSLVFDRQSLFELHHFRISLVDIVSQWNWLSFFFLSQVRSSSRLLRALLVVYSSVDRGVEMLRLQLTRTISMCGWKSEQISAKLYCRKIEQTGKATRVDHIAARFTIDSAFSGRPFERCACLRFESGQQDLLQDGWKK
jgi:hypothetical protein